VNSKNKKKLSVIDFYITNRNLNNDDFHQIKYMHDFIDMIIRNFEHINKGAATWIPVVPQLADKLHNNLAEFQSAVQAIWFPLDEGSFKNKKNLFHNGTETFFKKRSKTFIDALEEAHQETIAKLEAIYIDLDSVNFSINKTATIRQLLEKNKQQIIENFKILDSTWTNLVDKKSALIEPNNHSCTII
jgi:hypothetical protein